MNYPFWNPTTWSAREFQILGATMMRSHIQPGSEHPKNILLDTMKNPAPPLPVPIPTTEEFVARMDLHGYDKIFIPAIRMWSYWDNKPIWDYTIDEVYEHIKDYPDRLIPTVGYNPFRIEESLEEMENLPEPDVIASEIVENLEFALEQFQGIVEDLENE